jgi:protein SCO1/2
MGCVTALLRRVFPFALVAVAVALFAVACGGGSGDSKSTANADVSPGAGNDSGYAGGIFTPPVGKPTVILNDTSGKPFNFATDTKGQVTLVYMGYTHCPDICPTTMSDIGTTLKKLGSDVSSKVKVVFVTSDPARDTPDVLRKWLDSFDKDFIGLVPTDAQLLDFTNYYGLPPITKETLPNGDYAVDHFSLVFAYTQDNVAHLGYPGGITRDDWAHDLPLLVKQGYKGS